MEKKEGKMASFSHCFVEQKVQTRRWCNSAVSLQSISRKVLLLCQSLQEKQNWCASHPALPLFQTSLETSCFNSRCHTCSVGLCHRTHAHVAPLLLSCFLKITSGGKLHSQQARETRKQREIGQLCVFCRTMRECWTDSCWLSYSLPASVWSKLCSKLLGP